jgi:hypothetical protein
MRSSKLIPAVAAVASALLALVPAGALAAKHHRVKRHAQAIAAGGCDLKINAAPRLVEAGEPALVFGQLVCKGGTSVANQTVTVLGRSAPSPALTTIGTAPTDSTGHYQLTTPALQTNSQFSATALGAHSGKRTVRVSPKVTLSGPPDGSQLFTGAGPFKRARGLRSNTVTFTGTVSPALDGAIVALQRENTVGIEEWHRIGHVSKVGPGGSYSITHTFGAPGDANIRVVVRPSRRNAAGASEPLSYEISQAQNPALTIQSSANPIFYGQPVTISGTIASGAGTTLTLLAHTRTQKSFVPIATTSSTAGGTYTFPVQTPLQSTGYEVTGAGKTSTHLFEGVKYGLTAGVSANTVQAGQSLTFSGTVTPGHSGHAVYLQAQYPSGIGFHVIQVGTVTAGSTYSISYVPFVAGAKKFRIKVPGDPENQGVASSLFEVSVTPAPAAALKPEAPGNSSPPREGKL